MEYIVNDYLWFEYEGKIISETWDKHIHWKGDFKKQTFLVDTLFKREDIIKFYQIGHAINNISNLFDEKWAYNYILKDKYDYIIKDSEKPYIDLLLLEYHIWRFQSDKDNLRIFLEKMEN